MIEPVLFGVGGNVGTDDELRARFRQARTLLASLSEQQGLGGVRSAPLYRTAPIGPAQRPFLNTALLVPLDLEPEDLPEAIGGASFSRALGAFGLAVFEVDRPRSTPWI